MNDVTPKRVGIIGAGRIVRTGHLPAYLKGGIPVVGVCSASRASAERLIAETPDAKVYDSAADLAADPAIELLDVATRPQGRLALIRELLPYGKPILLQKPAAYTVAEAAQIAREAREADVPVAVNHNLRWAPAQRLLLGWARDGRLGDIGHLAHVHHFAEDVEEWYTTNPGYLLLDHGLHYLDLARQIAGREPIAVAARTAVLPGQTAPCPLTYTIMLRFTGSLVASLTMYNRVRNPQAWASAWFVNGTAADACATYSTATLTTAEISSTFEPDGEWVPDGLLGAYNAFVRALDTGSRPEHDITDHLATLALAEAAVTSADSDGAWVDVPDTGITLGASR